MGMRMYIACLCGEAWSPRKFYDGTTTRCKECHKAYMRRRRRNDPTVKAREVLRGADPKYRAAQRVSDKRRRLAKAAARAQSIKQAAAQWYARSGRQQPVALTFG
jgi:hypothetical protein